LLNLNMAELLIRCTSLFILEVCCCSHDSKHSLNHFFDVVALQKDQKIAASRCRELSAEPWFVSALGSAVVADVVFGLLLLLLLPAPTYDLLL
jgi:hypothetical protein